MSVRLQYDHFDANASGCTDAGFVGATGVCAVGAGQSTSFDSMQLVKFGGLINF